MRAELWPDGYQSAASFSFDVDGEAAALAGNPESARSMGIMSHQAYGPLVGVRRILNILDRHGLRCTFMVPGRIAEWHPATVRDIAAAGHEIAHHGYDHVTPTTLDRAAQADQLDRGLDALEKLTRTRAVGYRAPMWDLSWDMPSLLAERGFLYDSSLMDGDAPYRLATNPADIDGSTSIMEIPIQWALDDWEQYCFLPGITELGPIQTPRHARELWLSEFEAMHAEGACWVLTNHPFLSGRPGRAAALDRLIGDVLETPGVWTAALDEIATHASTRVTTSRSIQPLP